MGGKYMETNKNFAVIGLGEFGSRICEVLVDGGASVVAFDHDIQAVERIKKNRSGSNACRNYK